MLIDFFKLDCFSAIPNLLKFFRNGCIRPTGQANAWIWLLGTAAFFLCLFFYSLFCRKLWWFFLKGHPDLIRGKQNGVTVMHIWLLTPYYPNFFWLLYVHIRSLSFITGWGARLSTLVFRQRRRCFKMKEAEAWIWFFFLPYRSKQIQDSKLIIVNPKTNGR